MEETCIFCKIVKGQIQSYKVYEDDKHLVFLTIEPFKEGHTLVVPKKHCDYLFDMDSEELCDLMIVCKGVAEKLRRSFKPKSNKVGVVVLGDEVAHAHIHLIPFDSAHDLTLAHPQKAAPEQLQQALDKITSENS